MKTDDGVLSSRIRPYSDDDVGWVRKVIKSEGQDLCRNLKEEFKFDLIRKIKNARTIDDLQVLAAIFIDGGEIPNTVSKGGYTTSGVEGLEGKVILCNHSSVLEFAKISKEMKRRDMKTPFIVVGENLYYSNLIKALFKSNKCITLPRPDDPSKDLRAKAYFVGYLQELVKAGETIIIASTLGRVKDGNYHVDPSIISLVSRLRGEMDLHSFVDERVTLGLFSYEYLAEAWLMAIDLVYRKLPDNDLESMKEGVRGFKGRMDISIYSPEIGDASDIETIAMALSVQMIKGIKIWPSNNEAFLRLYRQQLDYITKRRGNKLPKEIEQYICSNYVPDEPWFMFNEQIQKSLFKVRELLLNPGESEENLRVPDMNRYEIMILRMYGNVVRNYLNLFLPSELQIKDVPQIEKDEFKRFQLVSARSPVPYHP